MTLATPSRAGEPEGQRAFTDPDGRHWSVAEDLIPPTDWTVSDHEGHRAGYAVGWLIFRGVGMQKRLRLFPVHWRTLPDVALDQLCRRALEVRCGE